MVVDGEGWMVDGGGWGRVDCVIGWIVDDVDGGWWTVLADRRRGFPLLSGRDGPVRATFGQGIVWRRSASFHGI